MIADVAAVLTDPDRDFAQDRIHPNAAGNEKISPENKKGKQRTKTQQKARQGELDAALMCSALADAVKGSADARSFRRLAAEEGRLAAAFKALAGKTLKPKKTLATVQPILYRLLGKKRLSPILAKFV